MEGLYHACGNRGPADDLSGWLFQREASFEMRQRFIVGPDEQVEAPTVLRGPLRITEGAVTGNGASKNEGEKCTVGCTVSSAP
jgi:hypothetical protein